MSTTCLVPTNALINLGNENGSDAADMLKNRTFAIPYENGEFNAANCFYPKALNATINPIVKKFFNMKSEAIIKRYVQLNPGVDAQALRDKLEYTTKYFKWAGCDLFNVTNRSGKRQMIIVESNSCPSGQKSMPLVDTNNKYGGYKTLIESCFADVLNNNIDKSLGGLAVIYDKNKLESIGFCSTLAELANEKVWLAQYFDDETAANSICKWENGLLHVRDVSDKWHPIRACIRYVTQRPWKRIPLNTKTKVINPIVSCLAGGRNKIMAVHAYNSLNKELKNTGLGKTTTQYN